MSLVKNYTYRDIPYTISVYLNYAAERGINGKRLHKITTEIEQLHISNHFNVDANEDIKAHLKQVEEGVETIINEFLDGSPKGLETAALIELGFTEVNPIRKPIKPDQMPTELPAYIIEAFDILIAEKFNISKKESTIYIKEAVAKVIEVAKSKNIEVTSNYLFSNNLMDVEDTYRKAGWKVTYHKPDYTESSFPEFYIFKKK